MTRYTNKNMDQDEENRRKGGRGRKGGKKRREKGQQTGELRMTRKRNQKKKITESLAHLFDINLFLVINHCKTRYVPPKKRLIQTL